MSLCAVGLLGCPGELDHPEQFDQCRIVVERKLFGSAGDPNESKCGSAGCHNSKMPQGALDLVSPGVADRLLTSKSVCGGDAGAHVPLTAFILEKVKPNPTCGDAMPFGMTTGISAGEYDCLEKYIRGLTDGGM
ncbi:MAG: hypothetical protein K1X64_07850 [Myxococcaceae bacterium]|nr:hypothetical protein [Myxococcaceae bacterium]